MKKELILKSALIIVISAVLLLFRNDTTCYARGAVLLV